MLVDTSAETLEFLLVSSEAVSQNTVQSALTEMGAALGCATSAEQAGDLLKTQKVDGVILDLEIKSALKVISGMRQTKNARAFAFVCVNNEAESTVALKCGANALWPKPLSAKSISSSINSFRSIIASERRRYRRHKVTMPAIINLNQHTYQAIIQNISQGGMAIHLPCLLPESSLVNFSFELESATAIEGSAQLRWANEHGMTGLEFRSFASNCKRQLIAWLRDRCLSEVSSDAVERVRL